MLPLCGRPALQLMLERLGPLKKHCIIATTNDGSEKPITELCDYLNVPYFKGDTDDVLGRFYHAAKAYGAKPNDTIVRLTADCPLIDKDVSMQTINFYHETRADYVIAGPHCGWPRGLDTAVFSFQLLEEAFLNADKSYEREHVTPYIHTTIAERLTIRDFTHKPDHSHWRLTLDEIADYHAIQAILNLFNCRTDFTYMEMAAALESHPEITNINKNVRQKSMLE
jgi:spore coat polysaccharide biosynthesis protein SpsF